MRCLRWIYPPVLPPSLVEANLVRVLNIRGFQEKDHPNVTHIMYSRKHHSLVCCFESAVYVVNFAFYCEHPVVGIRPGEKIHEEMITTSDSYTTVDCGKRSVFNGGGTTSVNPGSCGSGV
jgi:hypothetical protein